MWYLCAANSSACKYCSIGSWRNNITLGFFIESKNQPWKLLPYYCFIDMGHKGSEPFEINTQPGDNWSESKFSVRNYSSWSECLIKTKNVTYFDVNCARVYAIFADPYEYFLGYYHFHTKMCTFVFGPMILLGLVGNIVSFFTWGKIAHQNALTFLLRALAVIDCCLLTGEVFRVLTDVHISIYHVDGWLYTTTKVLGPYTHVYIQPLVYIALLANILTSVCIGMNRYIVVCKPLQATQLCTTSHARKQVICIVLLSLLFILPSFFECEVVNRSDGLLMAMCTFFQNKWYLYIYRIGLYFMFGSLIPFGFLTFFCVRVIITLYAARRQPIDRHGDRLQETRVTSMVLVLLGIFVVCHVYWWIQLFCVCFLPADTVHRYIWGTYGLSFAELVIILNSSVNCWIYCAFFNKFRRALCTKCSHRSETNQAYEMS